MGMAASQARYLALVARKSNCEYEGQQINQARTLLSNQSANLFNQMLGLEVPVPPSTTDFTKKQYSYSDGAKDFVIDNWEQLATPEDEYNYIVNQHYYSDIYTGSQKKMVDPKVQFTGETTATTDQVTESLALLTRAQSEYDTAVAATKSKIKEAANLANYADRNTFTGVSETIFDNAKNSYSVTQTLTNTTPDGNPIYNDENGVQYYIKDNKYYKVEDNTELVGDNTKLVLSTRTVGPTEFIGYNKLSEKNQAIVKDSIDRLVKEGALTKESTGNYANVYFDPNSGAICFKDALRSLKSSTNGNLNTILTVYNTKDGNQKSVNTIANAYDAEIAALKAVEHQALQTVQLAQDVYDDLKHPTYIGNSKLTPLANLTDDQKAELMQIVTDMKKNDINSPLIDCFDGNGNYLGGIYEFKMNGKTYYTTFEELNESYISGTGINNIDDQTRLTYYNASYVSTKIEEKGKALLATDGSGRFTTVRFENNSVTYELNVESITDEAAYKDAMNQYNYKNAQYDKRIQDINAKTLIIQQEDQQLELRLKQLDTEQQALTTEMEAVAKVVKDNIEKSFKTFGG